MALRAAYLTMHRNTDAALARFKVTGDQFVLLTALARGDAVTQRDLARRTVSDANTVRAMLLLLEARGLVARNRHPTDARARTVSLTAKGRRAYRAVWAASEPVREDLMAAFKPGQVETLFGLLKNVSMAMGRAEEGLVKAETVNEKP